MQSTKIVCINLERRPDRKAEMTKMFDTNGIKNYRFFKAFDGLNLDLSNPQLSFFKHDYSTTRRRAVVGCALSHYNVWIELLDDPNYEYYVILEDDVRLAENFNKHLETYVNGMSVLTPILFLGMSVTLDNYAASRNIYEYSTAYNIGPLTREYFTGGLFGYVISKTGAKMMLNYININGIKRAIDYVVFDSNVKLYETSPHIVFTDSVQDSVHYVDSDIQRDFNEIEISDLHTENNHIFDDYDFYPSVDSFGQDIMQCYCDIKKLKEIADSMQDCVAFNTYGWLKFDVSTEYKFIYLRNKYYSPDGLYIKKSYNKKSKDIRYKVLQVNNLSKTRPIKFFIGKCAKAFADHIVDMILNNFPEREIVESPDTDYDILINSVCDAQYYFNDRKFNILISGEPWNVQRKYDLNIDTKLKSNIKTTIYYPFLFSSMREHRFSINPADYTNTREKFCAFMYSISYPHRIRFFEVISKYKWVDSLGRCRKNVQVEDTREVHDANSTFNDIAVNIYTQYKFVIAVENTWIGGYVTEKLINPLIAGSIPIFWGEETVFQYINKERLVYIPDYKTDEELIDRIRYLDTNTEAYNEMVNKPIYVDPDFTLEKIEADLNKKINEALTL